MEHLALSALILVQKELSSTITNAEHAILPVLNVLTLILISVFLVVLVSHFNQIIHVHVQKASSSKHIL